MIVISFVPKGEERYNQSDSSSSSWQSIRSLTCNERKMRWAFDQIYGQDPDRYPCMASGDSNLVNFLASDNAIGKSLATECFIEISQEYEL